MEDGPLEGAVEERTAHRLGGRRGHLFPGSSPPLYFFPRINSSVRTNPSLSGDITVTKYLAWSPRGDTIPAPLLPRPPALSGSCQCLHFRRARLSTSPPAPLTAPRPQRHSSDLLEMNELDPANQTLLEALKAATASQQRIAANAAATDATVSSALAAAASARGVVTRITAALAARNVARARRRGGAGGEEILHDAGQAGGGSLSLAGAAARRMRRRMESAAGGEDAEGRAGSLGAPPGDRLSEAKLGGFQAEHPPPPIHRDRAE